MGIVAKQETRDGFGDALIELAKKYDDVIAMDCDLGRSTRSHKITEIDPNRFIDMGIAEQDMISTAAGMAITGKTVFVNSFAIFITGRAFDQIRQQISLPNANVKICGSSSGLTQGPDGATHQSVLDISLMRTLPNMTVIVPSDYQQAKQAVFAAYKNKGAFYIRLSRYATGALIPSDQQFEIGKAQVIKEGGKIALCSCGPILNNIIESAELLDKDGIETGIYNFPTIKPIDTDMIKKLTDNYDRIVTVEEHSIIGGLGSAIAEVIAESDNSVVLQRLGVNDTFGESGVADELLEEHGLSAEGIASAVKNK